MRPGQPWDPPNPLHSEPRTGYRHTRSLYSRTNIRYSYIRTYFLHDEGKAHISVQMTVGVCMVWYYLLDEKNDIKVEKVKTYGSRGVGRNDEKCLNVLVPEVIIPLISQTRFHFILPTQALQSFFCYMHSPTTTNYTHNGTSTGMSYLQNSKGFCSASPVLISTLLCSINLGKRVLK